MHTYNDVVKSFLLGYLRRTRSARHLTKAAMSAWLRIDPRSYPDLEKGRYCLSTPCLLFLLAGLEDQEVLDLLRQFRLTVTGTKPGPEP